MASNDATILLDAMPFFRIYEDRRIERFPVIATAPPSVDPATGVSSRDELILPELGVSARLYLPNLDAAGAESTSKLPVLVYYHGGGFCVGSASSAPLHSYINSLAADANVIVVSVDYRLAPEHPVPVAYDDAGLAFKWVVSGGGGGSDKWLTEHADLGQVYVAGDSAGANIAHHTAMLAGAEELPQGVRLNGLILIHPYFMQPKATESDTFDERMSSGLKRLWPIMCPSTTGLDDYRINPMAGGAPSLRGMGCGRVLVCVGGRDALRDGGRAYWEELRGSGWRGAAELFEADGEGHVFHVYKPECEQAQAQHKRICKFLSSQ